MDRTPYRGNFSLVVRKYRGGIVLWWAVPLSGEVSGFHQDIYVLFGGGGLMSQGRGSSTTHIVEERTTQKAFRFNRVSVLSALWSSVGSVFGPFVIGAGKPNLLGASYSGAPSHSGLDPSCGWAPDGGGLPCSGGDYRGGAFGGASYSGGEWWGFQL